MRWKISIPSLLYIFIYNYNSFIFNIKFYKIYPTFIYYVSITLLSILNSFCQGMDEGLMFSCPMCPFRTVKRDNYLAHKAEHDLGGDPRGRRKKPPADGVQVRTGTII